MSLVREYVEQLQVFMRCGYSLAQATERLRRADHVDRNALLRAAFDQAVAELKEPHG